jgi:hypothetical protein
MFGNELSELNKKIELLRKITEERKKKCSEKK